MSRLNPVSYLVLGLVAQHGKATPYELKRDVSGSVGNFWSFPHSQLYAEPERLRQEGYLEEVREESGRRRRYFAITDAGRAALAEWLADTSQAPSEIRSLSLLKLFFGGMAHREDMAALARTEVEAHSQQVAHYRSMLADSEETLESEFPLLTLRLGIAYEQTAVDFWSDVVARLGEASS